MSAHLCILIIKKDILILGKGLKQRLDDTTIKVKATYSMFYKTRKEILFKFTLQ